MILLHKIICSFLYIFILCEVWNLIPESNTLGDQLIKHGDKEVHIDTELHSHHHFINKEAYRDEELLQMLIYHLVQKHRNYKYKIARDPKWFSKILCQIHLHIVQIYKKSTNQTPRSQITLQIQFSLRLEPQLIYQWFIKYY